ELGSSRFQRLDVFDRGGMRPHFSVHRRRDQNRRAGGERNRGQWMVCQPVGELSEDVGGGRRDQKEIRTISQFDMSGPPAFFFVEEARHHRVLGKRLQSKWRDEFGRVARHYYKNLVTLFYQ